MKEKFEFVIDETNVNKRLDIAIVDILKKKVSRSSLKNYLTLIMVNGKREKFSYKCRQNDSVNLEIEWPEENEDIIPEDIPIEIIHEDDNYIVVNKKHNMVVHPAKGNFTGTLINALLGCKKSLSENENKYRIGVVHRLDKETSGLIIFAKNREAHEYLGELFKTRKIVKKYHSVVKGTFPLSIKIIENNIGRSPKNRKKMAVLKHGGKKSITIIEDVKYYDNYSYLDMRLITGRTHQIRVHLSNLGYPVLGDAVYSRIDNNFPSVPLCLVSYHLSFSDKFSNKQLDFSIEDPIHIKDILKILNH